jgi:hypothetical protein
MMQNFGQVGVPHIKIDKAPDAGFRLEQPGHFLSSSGPLHPGHTDRAFFRDGLGGKSLIEASANGIVLYLPYNCELARPGTPNGIDALIAAHHAHAGGESCILHADPDLYISQRGGTDSQSGLIYVWNNLGNQWSGSSIKTKWANQKFKPVAGTVRMVRTRTNALPMRRATLNFPLHHAAIACMLR